MQRALGDKLQPNLHTSSQRSDWFETRLIGTPKRPHPTRYAPGGFNRDHDRDLNPFSPAYPFENIPRPNFIPTPNYRLFV